MASLAEKKKNPIAVLVSQARERVEQELRAHSEELEKLEKGLDALRKRSKQLEEAVQEQLDALGKAEVPAGAASSSEASLENVLAAVRNLITATLPEQVHDVLTEEAEQMGVRAAVFDVRGKAAWGASARGFSRDLTEKTFRALVVPLNQDNPFRHAYETGGHVDLTADQLKKARNVFDKFKPDSGEPILLVPIRSAGAVSAIFYSDPGGKGQELPVDALKILTEFAGAQLDRLMALSGAIGAVAAEKEAAGEEVAAVAERDQEEAAAVVEAPPPPPPRAEKPAAPPAAAGFDISQLNEADQKVHKDAKRFAKLLVSEIDLYNKPKVADGRKNSDLYKRLKADIDRSRLTYEKRFGKTVGRQFDYFHDEVVKTLAANDPSVLGSEYPGPSV